MGSIWHPLVTITVLDSMQTAINTWLLLLYDVYYISS